VLDVFSEHDDKDIYDCLRRVYLLPEPSKMTPEEAAEHKFANLDTEVSEQGSNFSSGERQLLAMAQAMLSRHKIMILDEATSSVDFKTDELISTTIADSFHDITYCLPLAIRRA
jgi:ABC-type multidrug transport system fused ATPase/permease subunit